MQLFHLISNTWAFSFPPSDHRGGVIPGASIWRFDLDGTVCFVGNMYGEDRYVFRWGMSNGVFFVEGFEWYGLIEFKFNSQMNKLTGKRTLENNSVLPFNADVSTPINDQLFYSGFRKYLQRTWRILSLGSAGLVYFEFKGDRLQLFDSCGLKEIYAENTGRQNDWGYGLVQIEYLYTLEGQSIGIIHKDTLEKSGRIHLDDNKNLTGTFAPPHMKRKCFVELGEMTDLLIKELISEVKEEDQIF